MPSEQKLASQDTLDSSAVMKRLHISRRTLERYVADGSLRFYRLPSGQRRYESADVEALLSSSTPDEDAPSSLPPGDDGAAAA